MRRFAIVTLAFLVAGAAFGATVILKGGKKIEAASFVQKGNYVLVQYANGRSESYPLNAVDLEAMNAAAAKPKPGPAPTVGPHSPFFGAQAQSGRAGAVFTDADLERIHQPVEETAGEDKDKDKAKDKGEKAGRVVLASYDKKLVEPGQWDLTLTVSNAGTKNVLGIIATAHFLGPQGEPLGSGSGNFPGPLEPGKQGTISVHVASEQENASISFDFQWEEERTVTPAASPSPTPEAPKKSKALPAPAPASQQPAGYTRPAGSSPNALPSNPMGVVPLTQPPVQPQAGTTTAKPK